MPGQPPVSHCPFEKAIISGQCSCEHAGRAAIGEHLGVTCRGGLAQVNCVTLLELLRERSRFALRVSGTEQLPFGKELRLMIGGLQGLQQVVSGESHETRVPNIHGLIAVAQATFGGLHAVPFDQVIKGVAAYHPRRRHNPR